MRLKTLRPISFSNKRSRQIIRYHFYRANVNFRLCRRLTHVLRVHEPETFLDRFEDFGNYEAALEHAEWLHKRTDGAEFYLRLPRYYHKTGRRIELERWFVNALSNFETNPLEYVATNGRRGLVELVRASEFLSLSPDKKPTIFYRMIAARNDALVNSRARRLLDDMIVWFRSPNHVKELVFKKGQVVTPKMLQAFNRYIRLTAPLGDFAVTAGNNELSYDRRYPLRKNEKHPSAISEVEVFLPTHFFADWGNHARNARRKNWEEVRRVYSCFLRTLTSRPDFQVYPRIQYFMNHAGCSGDRLSISFFTQGGPPTSWHFRDAGYPNKFTLDPDGFWGCSSLSLANFYKELRAKRYSGEALERTATDFAESLSAVGGDKYGVQGPQRSSNIKEGQYIFCPLQSPRGVEYNDIHVQDFIRTMSNYARHSGITVVFKPHPLCKSVMVRKLVRDAVIRSNCLISTDDTWHLTKNAIAVCTINSAAALLAVGASKPLVTCGRSDVRSVSINAATPTQLWERLDDVVINNNYDYDTQKIFLHMYWRHYLLDAEDSEAIHQRLGFIKRVSTLDNHKLIRQRFIASLLEQD